MNETETQVTETTAAVDADNWDDIDLSDVDITVDDKDTDIDAEQTANDTETAPKADEADQQTQTDGEADKDTTETEETKETDQFTLKYLGEEVTKSRDEVIALAQKGMDYDRVKQKSAEQYAALETEKTKADGIISEFNELAKQSGFNSADEMLDDVRATMLAEKEGITKQAALKEIRIDRKERELAAKEAKQNAEKDSQKQLEEKRNADFAEFAREYKNIDPPKEVWDIYSKGNITLVQAMKQHENSLKDAEIAKLKSELEAERKTKENASRSAGSRSSVGKSTQDEFDKLWYGD